jgi:nucleotide-binding universal stress UspA family protein
MLKSMLLVLDGSQASRNAVDLGLRLATSTDALLVAIGLLNVDALCGAEAVPLGAGAFKQQRDEILIERERNRMEQVFAQFSIQCAQRQVACKVLDLVESTHELCQQAQRYDLVLLARAASGDAQSRIDDTAISYVVKHAGRPVIVVPPRPSSDSRRVLIAYDASLPAAETLQIFLELALPGYDALDIVSVDPDYTQAAERAALAADFLANHNLQARVHAIASNRAAAEEILDQTDRLGVGLLVMGAFGHTGLRELLLGSVTWAILSKSPVPVLLYH